MGGYDGPLFTGPEWMLIKMYVYMILSIWVRSTLPRVRYDRLMTIGWKMLLPAGHRQPARDLGHRTLQGMIAWL